MFQDLQKNGAGSRVEEQQRMGARKILVANNKLEVFCGDIAPSQLRGQLLRGQQRNFAGKSTGMGCLLILRVP